MLLLWLLSAAAAAAGRRRWATLGAVVGMLGLIVAAEAGVARRLLAPLQAAYLRPPELAWQPRNTIVVLGAGTVQLPASSGQPLSPGLFAYPRLVRAMALYRSCIQAGRRCRVLLSGGDPVHFGESEAATYVRTMRAMGVSPADLLEERRSLNTRQNAAFTAALLKTLPADQPAGQLILVSSGWHLRRASACFAAQGLAVIPYAADVLEPGPGALPSSYNLALSDLALHEWGGLLRDRILVWLGYPL
ncbi:YdcF family protein [Frateuria aurantia]